MALRRITRGTAQLMDEGLEIRVRVRVRVKVRVGVGIRLPA